MAFFNIDMSLDMRLFYFLAISLLTIPVFSQTITGQLIDDEAAAVQFANVVLYSLPDSTLAKVETTDDLGTFTFVGIETGAYYIQASYIGLEDLLIPQIDISGSPLDLGRLVMPSSSVQLETAVVTARRALVEIKPDRTVFNVEGTINSAGENGLGLLRKAPGVLLDNNNNITVLGRSGVLIYVDGKRLPLAGDELSSYLENLPAEQIDRIDIITNPGAKYEAEGNAGIIDIRLKRDKSLGLNGSVSLNASQGIQFRSSVTSTLNYRNKRFNSFGSLGYNHSERYENFVFDGYQNDFRLLNNTTWTGLNTGINYRLGTDFFIGKAHTLGFLVIGGKPDSDYNVTNRNTITDRPAEPSYDRTPADIIIPLSEIDSVMLAEQNGEIRRVQNSYNVNYTYRQQDKQLNIDADLGMYQTKQDYDQPNTYLESDEQQVLNTNNYFFSTPIDIQIASVKLDYEQDVGAGKFSTGAKLSQVATDNTFLFFDDQAGNRIQDDSQSYDFGYDETVYAGYVSYNGKFNDKWNYTSGVRVEHTETASDLFAYDPDFDEPARDSSYFNIFPNVGLTYQASRRSLWSVNYGRRINRPDYNVLNPFRSQLSELDFSIGNPALKPEIVNNIELGYTLDYRYNFKLAYSRTTDQITRLIGSDDINPKASFINWDNLAEQSIYSLNISVPQQLTEKWSAFFNVSGSYKQNKATYPNGNQIDLDAWSYNIYQQHTITLPRGFTGEVSGWFSGPGIWGGVFEYDTSWSLNAGLQKKFLADKLSVKLAVQDIFRQAYWSGQSDFGGLLNFGQGDWDSRRGSISLTYNFGNSEVKAARKRQTSLEEEADRIGDN